MKGEFCDLSEQRLISALGNAVCGGCAERRGNEE